MTRISEDVVLLERQEPRASRRRILTAGTLGAGAAVLAGAAGKATAQESSEQVYLLTQPATGADNVVSSGSDVTLLTLRGEPGRASDVFQHVSGESVLLAAYSRGGISIRSDATDTFGSIDLHNLTPLSEQPAPPFKKPAINYKMDGQLHWQHGLDVGYGSFGSQDDLRHDFYLLHRNAQNPSLSADILYLTDELHPRVGINRNTPDAALHVANPDSTRPVQVLEQKSAAGVEVNQWVQRWDRNGSTFGGVWMDTSRAGSKILMSLGMTVKPNYALHVADRSGLQDIALLPKQTGYPTGDPTPILLATNAGGTYPFNVPGNLVLQPRVGANYSGDVLLAVGPGTPRPALAIRGQSRNLGINIDPLAPDALFGGGQGVLGLRNSTAAPGVNPVNGLTLWAQSFRLNLRDPGGGLIQIGSIPSGGKAGVAFGKSPDPVDVRLWREAPGVLAIDAVPRFAAADGARTAAAAGTADALPPQPATYLRVQDARGRELVVPAYLPPDASV